MTSERTKRIDLQSLFETAPGLSLALAPDGTILAASAAFLQKTRTEHGDLVGRSVFDVFPDDSEDPSTPSAGSLTLRASLERVRREGVADTMASRKYRVARADSEGGGFEERLGSPVNSPVRKPDGELAWILHRVDDVPPTAQTEETAQTTRLEEEIFLRSAERREAQEALALQTARLEAAHKEIETLAYSMSHDLRAPLRAIEGFGQILLEDFGDRLGPDGQHPLLRIRAATARMSEQIGELLKLSRVSRSEIHREQVDMSGLARNAARDAAKREPERRVEVVIAAGAVAEGDARLLAVALENLIGNAFKFTSKRDDPRIEFGVDRRSEGPVFFVRDNGAGFDMKYADKLFGPFQRLHATSEFRGTGIGLATVQRVLHRLGGRIWAEGEVGRGATFYFRLGGA